MQIFFQRRIPGFDTDQNDFSLFGSSFPALFGLALLVFALSALAEDPTTNQLPNPQFRGVNGSIETGGGSGTVHATAVPTMWRAYAVAGGEITVDIVPLAADAVFAGSPATNAVRLTVNTFSGGNQGFDDSPVRFSLVPGRLYNYNVWLLSDNGDASDQGVQVGFAQYDSSGTFVSGLGSTSVTATTSWQEFAGPEVSFTGVKTAEMAFRLDDDGGDDSILIAFPRIDGPEVTNLVPNPGFEGDGGFSQGVVAGTVPDDWRGFAIGGGAITLDSVAVAAGELYPGSPPTNGVRMTVGTFGTDQGFDHELVRIPVDPMSWSLRGEVYMRSESAPQIVTVSLNAFDNTPAYLGGQNLVATVQSSWSYFGSFSYQNVNTATADLAFRVIEGGPQNSVIIAMPRVNGIKQVQFSDGFEAQAVVEKRGRTSITN